MVFFPGLHQPSDAQHFPRSLISVNRLRARKSGFTVGEWIMDSGAFTELATYGRYRPTPDEYAAQIIRWAANGQLVAAVSQDFDLLPEN